MTLGESISNRDEILDGVVAIQLEDAKPVNTLSARGSVITYHDLSYTVRVKPKKKWACGTVEKTILHNLK